MHRSCLFSRLGRFIFSFSVLCSLGFPVRGQAGSNLSSNPLESEALQAYPYIRVLNSSASSLRFEFNAPAPQFARSQSAGQACQVVSMESLVNEEGLGQFALPVHGVMLGIPAGSAPTLEILSVESGVIGENFHLCPSSQPVFSSSFRGQRQLVGVEAAFGPEYQVAALSPGSVGELTSTGMLRSQPYAQVRLNPLQYNPVSGVLILNQHIVVELHFNPQASPDRLGLVFVQDDLYESTFQDQLLNYEQSKLWRTYPTPAEPSESQNRASQPAYKILVDQDGIYRLNYADLLLAGVPVDGLDPRDFSLYNSETEIALYVEGEWDGVFDPGEFLVFFGQKATTKYTDTNVYWLTWGGANGLRMADRDGAPSTSAEVPLDFQTTLTLADDFEYFPELPSGPGNDHWYMGFADSFGAFEFPFTLSNLSTAERTVTLRGLVVSYYEDLPEVQIFINNGIEPVFAGNLTGDPTYNVEFSFPQSLLTEGENVIRLETVLESDAVLVNYFEIDYYDTYQAENDQLNFDADNAGTWELQVNGFSTADIDLYDLTDPHLPVRISNASITVSSPGYQLAFEDSIAAERHYLALTASQYLQPTDILLDSPTTWRSPLNGADYIIISHADFIVEMQALADHRASQGMRVATIDVQDLYDEFNYGIFNPEAIKAFLAYAYENWVAPAPTYILLVGDGHYDYRDFIGSGETNFIPPYLADVDPWFGETATDNWFVSVSGSDILPDMAIGRFPVRSAAEAQTMVSKVINYEQNPPQGGWNGQITFIADNKDSGGDFALESDSIIGYIPGFYTSEKIYYGMNYTNVTATKTAIQNAFNQGRLIVHYAGHASTQSWASELLLRVSDLVNLTNADKLPLSLPMACLDGYFIWPGIPSLGESIVRKAGGGAIASWSPSGYGLTAGHMLLDKSLMGNLFDQNQTRLGYLATQAKVDLFATSAIYNDLIETFVLFGDPALDMQILPAPTDIQLSNDSLAENQPVGTLVGSLTSIDPDAGETFTYTLVMGSGDEGNASFQVVNDQLLTNAEFNYEMQSAYSIRVRSTDSDGYYREEIFTIQVINVNEQPTSLLLSKDSVKESQPVGTLVGRFSTSDPDLGDSFTYTLVAGEGDDGNSAFQIDGYELLTNAEFEYDIQAVYPIRVRSTDAGGLWTEEAFTIQVEQLSPPTDMALSSLEVAENQGSGVTVGIFSSTDSVFNTGFVYSLVPGEGDSGNPAFTIQGNVLRTATDFDFETQSTYSIRVRTTNLNELWFEKAFTLAVIDVNEAPTTIYLSNSSVQEGQPAGTLVGILSTLDPDQGDTFTYSLGGGGVTRQEEFFQIVDDQLLTNAIFDYQLQSSYAIQVRSTDRDGLWVEETFTIQIDPIVSRVDLLEGWNLVSFNVVPDSTAIADILADIAGKFDLVYAWDGSGAHSSTGHWLKFDPAQGFGNTLTTLDESLAFWILMNSADTLDVYGSQPVETQVHLYTAAGGWNLVGFPGQGTLPLPGALSGHGVSDFSRVYAYHAVDQEDPWKIFDPAGAVYANDLLEIAPLWGYWIQVPVDADWLVSY